MTDADNMIRAPFATASMAGARGGGRWGGDTRKTTSGAVKDRTAMTGVTRPTGQLRVGLLKTER
jgi:hypothetical protein